MNGKIVTKEQFSAIRDKLRQENKTIVHCHGVFDLIHPGHIIHLDEAKQLGDVLVVSITAEKYVQKGPGRPFFDDERRLLTLSVIEMVDYVILSHAVTAFDIIDFIKPDIYVKGQEYEKSENDLTANIDKETERVELHDGKVHYTKGQVFSSTKLLNTAFNALSKEVIEQSKHINNLYRIEDIKNHVDSFSNIKVLVVGDIIIDEYVFCEPQGTMSKEQAFSTRYSSSEMYLGGSLAIANHLSSFSQNVTLCTIAGTETNIHSSILNGLGKKMFLDLLLNDDYKTIIKRKYVHTGGLRKDYRKVFSVNYIQNTDEMATIDMKNFYNRLEKIAGNFDMVVLCDFGHGAVDEKVMEILQTKANFLALNCQTNSSNYGGNLITKYKRADSFALDEKEITLAFGDSKTDRKKLLYNLKQKLNSQYGWLTLGAKGAMGIDSSNSTANSLALTLNVVDTVGAGDAFFALTSLCALKNVPLELSTLLGNAAGAISANVLGNSQAISKAKVLKYISTVLNV